MEFATIRLEREGAVARIVLARSDRLNALTWDMAHELSRALNNLGDARALLLTGEGRAFCAGADLAPTIDTEEGVAETIYRTLTGALNPVILQLLDLPIPTVVAVNGAAAGIGCPLALAGDFVLAAESAYFLQAFVNIGLVPDGGSSWMLPRLIGTARAMEMMMLGERLPAARAEQWGLIHRCVDDGALQEEAMAIARRLAAGPTKALNAIRQNVRTAMLLDLPAMMDREAEAQHAAAGTQDGEEGVRSFLEKRVPRFSGN